MPGFTKGPGYKTPFGKNVPYRSTRGIRDVSKMFAANSFPILMIDGTPTKVLQPGMVLATITAVGDDQGKVGAYQPGSGAGTAEVQTFTEATAISAGTWDVNIFGVDVTDLAFDIVAADLQTALRAGGALSTDEALADIADTLVVTGGPIASTAFTVTFTGAFGVDVPAMVSDDTNLTGTITDATGTPGVVGALDGRQTAANIVGINKTFLPTQLLERDVEVAAMYTGTFVRANCFELNAAGIAIPITTTTVDAMRSKAALDCLFV